MIERRLVRTYSGLVTKLANPAAEYARVARDILPAEVAGSGVSDAVVTNIQSLYLTAVQAANREADPRVVNALVEQKPPVANDSNDW